MNTLQALVADDDAVTRTVVSRPLEQWGFQVTAVADGAAAWRYLERAEGPTLAVLDWMMPHLSGPDVCRQLRAMRPTSNIYAMLLTSLEGRRDMVAGLEAGADDYIVKPCELDELRARVQVGRRMLRLQQRLAEQVTELQAALVNVKRLHGLLPICSYCKRIRGDNQYWQQVEAYIAEHTDAQFSHGICPPCFDNITRQLDSASVRSQ
jgi:DNA-binding response OmpR family regulator